MARQDLHPLRPASLQHVALRRLHRQARRGECRTMAQRAQSQSRPKAVGRRPRRRARHPGRRLRSSDRQQLLRRPDAQRQGRAAAQVGRRDPHHQSDLRRRRNPRQHLGLRDGQACAQPRQRRDVGGVSRLRRRPAHLLRSQLRISGRARGAGRGDGEELRGAQARHAGAERGRQAPQGGEHARRQGN